MGKKLIGIKLGRYFALESERRAVDVCIRVYGTGPDGTDYQDKKTAILKEMDQIRGAVDAMINAAQLHCSARLLDADDVFDVLELANERLELISDSKRQRIGTILTADVNAQKFPNAYKYPPESTHFTAEYCRDGWRLLRVYRSSCRPPRERYGIRLSLSEDVKKQLADKMSHI